MGYNEAVPDDDEAAQPEQIRLLVVEDEPSEAALMLDHLSAANGLFTPTVAESLESAVQLCDTQPFDVVLLDLSLPDSQGLDTFRRFRRRQPALPIVIVTGAEQERTALAAIRDGAKDFLYKSRLTPEILMRSLRFALERGIAEGAAEHAAVEQLRRRNEQLLQRLATSGQGSAVGRALGSRSLRELSSAVFDGMVVRFRQVMELELDEMVFGTSHDSAARLKALAGELADVLAGPRDVVDVYDAALMASPDDITAARRQALEDVARTVAFELMGYLVSAYRARVPAGRRRR